MTAIEDRDGVTFFVASGSPIQPIKLVRTPGLRRDRTHPAQAHVVDLAAVRAAPGG